MSAHLPPDQPATTPRAPGGRSGCAEVLLAVLGFFLLLPGLCAGFWVIGLWGAMSAKERTEGMSILAVFAALFGLGIWLIIRAFRPPAG
jgi:hypothetical protein